jgi:GAF domain-containing protein
MPDWLRRLTTPPVFPDDEDKTRTAALLNAILWTLIATGGVAFLFFLFLPGGALYLPLVGVFLLGYVASMWLMRRGRLSAASLLFLVSIWISMAGVCLFFGGTETPSYFGFTIVVVAAGLLLGRQGAIVFAGLSVVAGLGIAWAQNANVLPAQLGTTLPVIQWGALSFFVAIAAGLINLASRGLNDALLRARRYAAELEKERTGLEVTVQERTRDLTRRARYLEATAAIAREATSELELDGLIRSVVNSISRHFGFYHAGIFLLDGVGEWAELKAASSEGGQKMLARGHRLRVGQEGTVGYVSRHGEPRIALDTGADAVFFDNPDLPQTRSEATLPLRVRAQVIGVLDVQSTEPEAFTQEDIAVLQTLADQVATAINNAQLFAQTQASLDAERRAYGELSRQAWTELLRTRPELGFARDEKGLSPASGTWDPHMRATIQKDKAVMVDDEGTTLALPILVRDQVIGVMNVERPSHMGAWTAEQIDMMQTLSGQLSVALDSARLYQDTQRRAVRERLMGEVTARMREALGVDAVLKTAAQEMRQALGLSKLTVRLAGRPSAPSGNVEVAE